MTSINNTPTAVADDSETPLPVLIKAFLKDKGFPTDDIEDGTYSCQCTDEHCTGKITYTITKGFIGWQCSGRHCKIKSPQSGVRVRQSSITSIKSKKTKKRDKISEPGIDETQIDGTPGGYFRAIAGDPDGDDYPFRSRLCEHFWKLHPELVARINPDAEKDKVVGYAEWADDRWHLYTVKELTEMVRAIAQRLSNQESLTDDVREAVKDINTHIRAAEAEVDLAEWDSGTDYMLLADGRNVINLTGGWQISPNKKEYMLCRAFHTVTGEELDARRQELKDGAQNNVAKLVNDWLPDDTATHKYLQVVLGTGLRGNPTKTGLMLLGAQGTGKSTLIDIIQASMGNKLSFSAPDEMFFEIRNKTLKENAKAKFAHGRYALLSEIPGRNSAIASGQYKEILSNTAMSMRKLYCEYSEVVPKVLPIIAGNYDPRTNNAIDGLERRIAIIRFKQRFDGTEVDMLDSVLADMIDKCRVDYLIWALEGLNEWHDKWKYEKWGLPTSKNVTDWTAEYFHGENQFLYYFYEFCKKAPEGTPVKEGHVRPKDLIARFKEHEKGLYNFLRLGTSLHSVIKSTPQIAECWGLYEGTNVIKGWVLKAEGETDYDAPVRPPIPPKPPTNSGSRDVKTQDGFANSVDDAIKNQDKEPSPE